VWHLARWDDAAGGANVQLGGGGAAVCSVYRQCQDRPLYYPQFLASVKTAFAILTVLCVAGVFASLTRENCDPEQIEAPVPLCLSPGRRSDSSRDLGHLGQPVQIAGGLHPCMPAGTLKQGAIAGVALAGDLCQPDFDRRRQRLGYPPAHVDRGGACSSPPSARVATISRRWCLLRTVRHACRSVISSRSIDAPV